MSVSASICVYLPLCSQFLKNHPYSPIPGEPKSAETSLCLKHLWVGVEGEVGKFRQISSQCGSGSTDRKMESVSLESVVSKLSQAERHHYPKL